MGNCEENVGNGPVRLGEAAEQVAHLSHPYCQEDAHACVSGLGAGSHFGLFLLCMLLCHRPDPFRKRSDDSAPVYPRSAVEGAVAAVPGRCGEGLAVAALARTHQEAAPAVSA